MSSVRGLVAVATASRVPRQPVIFPGHLLRQQTATLPGKGSRRTT
jgi:hypothetical protein